MRARLNYLLLVLCAALSGPAMAFPLTTHYWISTEPEQLSVESEAAWDAEASSDFVTYLLPLAWESLWWRSSQTYHMSMGSISSKQFAIMHRLKLNQALYSKLDFTLQWLEDRDFETDQSQTPVELRYHFNRQWSVSLFGMPSLHKSENDFGASFEWTPMERWRYRLSAVTGDFDRNRRNRAADRWVEQPYAFTLSSLYTGTSLNLDLFKLELHLETPSRREDGLGQTTDLQSQLINGSLVHQLNQDHSLGGRWLLDRQLHSENSTQTERRRILTQLEWELWIEEWSVRTGINLFYRQWRELTRQVQVRELLPSFWLSRANSPWSFGIDSTLFEKRELQTLDTDWENRLNLKYNIAFASQGELALLFTFDLDQLGSGETWEGGAGQFRVDF